MKPELEAKNLYQSFGQKQVLDSVDVSLSKGELVCVLGVSGVGKTTLFHILSGLLRPDRGSVEFRGKEITGKPGKISYMLQKDLLLPYKKVGENAAMPLILKGMSKKNALSHIHPLFEEFGIENTQELYPHELSGGMRQRAALLRTYVASEGVALLDEPFSALDTITKGKIHSWFLDIMEKIDLSVLFITHDIDEAVLLSDRIYILGGSPGRVVKEIEICESKPRRSDFNLTGHFLEYKKEIVSALASTPDLGI